jgi:hypothetical protein
VNARLADPDFEPTDEELRQLSRDAFSDVEQRHAKALERLHGRIAEARRAQQTKPSGSQ